MIRVLFKTESHFPADRKRLKTKAASFLKKHTKRNTEVSVSVVGNRMMKKLNRTYRDKNTTCTVLAFPLHETQGKTADFVEPPDDVLRLGDVIISFPEAVKKARNENKLVDDVMEELLLHGLSNLLNAS